MKLIGAETGTVTCQKSEPEPKKIVTVPQHWLKCQNVIVYSQESNINTKKNKEDKTNRWQTGLMKITVQNSTGLQTQIVKPFQQRYCSSLLSMTQCVNSRKIPGKLLFELKQCNDTLREGIKSLRFNILVVSRRSRHSYWSACHSGTELKMKAARVAVPDGWIRIRPKLNVFWNWNMSFIDAPSGDG